MKTRIIKTSIYSDEKILSLTPDVRFICIYLYTNSHIGLTDIYKIPVQLIQLETGYDISSIKIALDQLQQFVIIKHFNHLWVKLLRKDFASLVYSGDRNEIAVDKYVDEIPIEIKESFGIDTSIDSSIYTNNKSEIINNKSETSIYSDDFISFWNAYPSKVGKGGAWKSWEKIKQRPKVQMIIEKLETQKKMDKWIKDNGQYIPNPQTYLNQRRWEDEVQITKKGTINL